MRAPRVELAYECDFLTEGINAEVTGSCGVSLRVRRSPICLHAFPDVKRSQLIEIKIADVETTVSSFAARISGCHVRHTIQMNVMKNNELVVPRCNDILFEVIGSHFMCEPFSSKRMLGKVSGSAAVRND
jgi:hypothetical protein